MKTYELTTIADLLQVPSDRLEECLRDIQYAVEFTHLVYGELALDAMILPISWTDDGLRNVTMTDPKGKQISLVVSDKR